MTYQRFNTAMGNIETVEEKPSNWSRVLSESELQDFCGSGTRAWYQSATLDAIRLQMGGAWNCNDSETYMVARSYLALRGVQEFSC